jgi:hypothetical protein
VPGAGGGTGESVSAAHEGHLAWKFVFDVVGHLITRQFVK